MFDEEMDGAGLNGAGDVTGASGGDDGGWRDIDRRMRRLAARRSALDAEEARLLVEAKRAELHKHLGLGTFDEYLERVLGYAPTTGRDKLRVAEALQTLPAVEQALRTGMLSYSAVRVITRVATPGTEEEWVEYVGGMTVREIEQCVRCREPGDGPNERPRPDVEPRVVRMELPTQTYALFLEARRHLEREHGRMMTDAEFMSVVCRAALGGGRDGGDNSGGGDGRADSNVPPHQIAITVCADCQRGWHDTPGKSVELTPAAIERARCDAIELGHVEAGATLEPRGSRTVPPNIRRAVLARDRRRCVVPGCTSSRYVDVHHIRHWLHGGTHDPLNLVTLCGLHHDHHHDGVIVIAGTAAALTVTHADGRPYGAPPRPAAHAGQRVDQRAIQVTTERSATRTTRVEAKAALVKLGFKSGEATGAIERALAHVGEDAPLPDLVRAAVKETGRPRCG
ncbi:MAG TPA: DUF222 domain-containing protein [Kofleriaceae bacterium]|nr:DUF222 domain-containing protein [Kofleriaceae bacterium]